jgi:type III secretory pathway component EscU
MFFRANSFEQEKPNIHYKNAWKGIFSLRSIFELPITNNKPFGLCLGANSLCVAYQCAETLELTAITNLT